MINLEFVLSVKEWLKGKKTIIVGVVALCVLAGQYFNLIPIDLADMILKALGVTGVLTVGAKIDRKNKW